jgi:hypothetical protein
LTGEANPVLVDETNEVPVRNITNDNYCSTSKEEPHVPRKTFNSFAALSY